MGIVRSWGAGMGCNSQGISSFMAAESNGSIGVSPIVRLIMGIVFEALE